MKKKQGKLAKYLNSHFNRRCEERIGELLPRKDIIRRIQSCKSYDDLYFISKQSNTRSKYAFIFNGTLYHLIYDKIRHKLVTILYA